MICQRCGAETSSAICSECGFINDDPVVENTNSDSSYQKRASSKGENAPVDPKHKRKASRLVKKWRKKTFVGIIHLLARFLFTAQIVLSAIAFVTSVIVLAILTKFQGSFFTYITYVAIAIILGFVVSKLFMSIIHNLSALSMSKFMNKKGINGMAYYDIERDTYKDRLVRDACIIRKKPGWLGLFLPKALVDFQFAFLLTLWGGASMVMLMHYIDLAVLGVNPHVLTVLISIGISLFVGLHIFIPFKIYSSIMDKVYENKVYTGFY